MEQEILEKIEEQNKKLEEISIAVEKIKKYFFWTFVITIAVIVLPLIALMFAIPQFLNIYGGGGMNF